MMNDSMYGSGSMLWGMGWGGLLVVVVVILGTAALARHLFFGKRQ